MPPYLFHYFLQHQVGISDQNDVFVIAGSKYAPEVCSSLKVQELKKCKVEVIAHYIIQKSTTNSIYFMQKSPQVLFEKSDAIGWCLKAELMSTSSTAESMRIKIHPSLSMSL